VGRMEHFVARFVRHHPSDRDRAEILIATGRLRRNQVGVDASSPVWKAECASRQVELVRNLLE
jgi:hypothetical protein